MDSFCWPVATVPQIAVAGRFVVGDRNHETRYRGSTHALCLHDYTGQMRLAGVDRLLGPGDITLSPAGHTSSYHLDAPGQHWCIHFSTVADQGATVSVPLHLTAASAGNAPREHISHIAALHARAHDNPIATAQARLELQALLIGLSEVAAPQPPLAELAAAIIDERFAEPLDPPAIAASLGRSQAHLARAFRARFGTTVPHRLIVRRVEHARYLLESTDLPIWRVAERVGMPDTHHFNKSVRRLLGASPSTIRARSGASTLDQGR